VNAFHHFNQERVKKWPHTMLCLSTHDSKHGADARTGSVFLTDFIVFESRTRSAGLLNALAQTLLHLASPGVPDIYQGHESWQFTLVDPDNRRPVDFGKNGQLVKEMSALLAQPDVDRPRYLASLWENREDRRVKLFVVMQTLQFRHRHAALFRDGDYLKINAHGSGADRLTAFARRHLDDFAVIAAPRLNGLGRPEDDTWLALPENAPRHYREWFSQCTFTAEWVDGVLQRPVRAVFKLFPLAILSALTE
jgi:(1->4)-alpha-D-glucan 1-alpha-D-glucosylmutase